MRAIIAIIVWVGYLICSNLYFASFGIIEIYYSKLVSIGSTLLLLLYCIAEILAGFTGYIHKAFIIVCISAIAANHVLLMAYYMVGMDNYKANFCIFNGVELFTALIILFRGSKHDLFNYEQNTVH